MPDIDLDDLRNELDEYSKPKKDTARSPIEERVIAGFEEIQLFFENNGRIPGHGEENDIFERLYAVRLDRLKALTEYRLLLAPLDHQGLLSEVGGGVTSGSDISDDELRAELNGAAGSSDITELRHVRKNTDKREAEEIANRTVCTEFEKFKPMFEQVKSELKAGVRQTLPFKTLDEIKLSQIQDNELFIVQGQMAYIIAVGEDFTTQYERRDSRLRVIYDNGTESDLLMRSFQRALYRDPAARIITNPEFGDLFAEAEVDITDENQDETLSCGTIYVLRSNSDHPTIKVNRDLLHKIGVTGGKVAPRIANAKLDPTFLMADVEVIATYDLYNIHRAKLENLIHRIFSAAQLDIEIKDRFGKPVKPKEWFLVPLSAINEAVEHIKSGTITDHIYDPTTARLVKVEA